MREPADLVVAAAAGDQEAWGALVDRYAGLLWAIARAHRLSAADAADVMQTVWLRLAEYLDRIRKPGSVGAWLATTMRRECLRVLRRHAREQPAGDDVILDIDAPYADTPEDLITRAERDALLRQALEHLCERCWRLLRVLVADPPPTYEQVSAALDMPVGSIGPTRARCLERLRRSPLLARI